MPSSTPAVKVDYFAPIQKALDNHKVTSSLQLLSEDSASSKKKMNRKRGRTSETTSTSDDVTKTSLMVTPSDKEYNLCTKSKKKRRSFQKSSRCLNCDNGEASSEIPTTTTKSSETDFNIQISSFTQSTYIPTMRKEELMGRYFKSFINDPVEPVPYEPLTDDAALQVLMFPYDNTKKYKVSNPDSDDYLESLQKRFSFDN